MSNQNIPADEKFIQLLQEIASQSDTQKEWKEQAIDALFGLSDGAARQLIETANVRLCTRLRFYMITSRREIPATDREKYASLLALINKQGPRISQLKYMAEVREMLDRDFEATNDDQGLYMLDTLLKLSDERLIELIGNLSVEQLVVLTTYLLIATVGEFKAVIEFRKVPGFLSKSKSILGLVREQVLRISQSR
jgi:hypothetical protein